MKSDLPVVKISQIEWPREITQDTEEMRPGFKLSWSELEKVAARKAPITDLTKVHMAMAALYVKRTASENNDKAFLMMVAKRRGE